MDEDRVEAAKRFPLRLPVEMDREIRELAKGGKWTAPSTINDMIVQLLKEALRARKERRGSLEDEPGQRVPARLAA